MAIVIDNQFPVIYEFLGAGDAEMATFPYCLNCGTVLSRVDLSRPVAPLDPLRLNELVPIPTTKLTTVPSGHDHVRIVRTSLRVLP